MTHIIEWMRRAQRRRKLAVAGVAVGALLSSTTLASGFPPFVFSDSITVNQGASVSVLDSGESSVLANDFDFEGDVLVAVLTRNVQHGTLTLNRDGTFVYRHDGSDEDDDEFRYRAFDGTGFSRREAVVEIDIEEAEPVVPQITGQRTVSIAEDDSREIELTDLVVVDGDNQFPQDFTLEVSAGDNYSLSGAVVTPRANFNGELSVPVRVFDGTNFSNSFALRVDVEPRNDPPFTTGAPADQEAIEGEPFSLSLSGFFDDIDAGDRLRFSASGLPSSGSLRIGRNSGVLSGTPIAADASDTAYSVRVTATDQGGDSASVTFSLLIFAETRSDLDISGSSVSNPTVVGESARWTLLIENRGPAFLEEGELAATWATSGPGMTLSVPEGCTVTDNDTAAPSLSCPLSGIEVGGQLALTVDGTQAAAGDNTVTATVTADDPVTSNNVATLGAQVVAAFSEGPSQVIDQPAVNLAQGDFNGDARVDVVASGSEARVYLNAGDRSLQEDGIGLGGDSGSTVVAVIDWNSDQAPDVLTAGDGAGIFVNDGAAAFSARQDLPIAGGSLVQAAGVADFDNDGAEDVVLTGSFGTLLMLNRVDVETREIAAVSGLDLVVADLNRDGFADVAVLADVDRAIQVFLNDGLGAFAAGPRIEAGAVGRLGSGDVDGDGGADLLAALERSGSEPPTNRVLFQQSDGSFLVGDAFGASAVTSLLAGDVDGDGDTDVVAINQSGVHQTYLRSAVGSFELGEEQIVSFGMQAGLLTDFNTDQSLDLILAGATAGAIEVHANNGVGRLGLGDRVAPELSLLGETSITMAAGGVFTDPGATATDDVEGDISDRIVVESNLVASSPGTYTVSYAVADRAGNTSQASRTVIVQVNEGSGGGGGGAPAPLALMLLLFASLVRSGRRV